jgi:DNA-binding transcriptional regulator YiaG
MDTTLDAPRAPRLVTECEATMSTRKPRLKANLVVRSRIALRLSQKELGALMGVSMRTAHRWEAGASEPDSTQLQKLALAVLPGDGDLAAELAEAGGTTLETLRPPVAPVAPPEPVGAAAAPAIAPRAFPPVILLLDSILIAAADAADEQGGAPMPRPTVRRILGAAVARARALGLSLEEVDGALRADAPALTRDRGASTR